MQAILTKYVCPTNYRGSRVRAICAAKSITIEWNPALNIEENHINAAQVLRDKLNWSGKLVTGTLKDGSYVHVLLYP